MGLFIPRQQLRDMQQTAAGQLMKGGSFDPAERQKYLAQAVAASILLGSPVQVVDDSLAMDPLTLDDPLFWILKDFSKITPVAIVTLKFPNFSRSNGFLLGQRLAQCRFIHRIMRYARKISTMIGVEEQGTAINLAWAVLTRATAGRSEVVKITSHEEADDFVRRNPDMFYKSGPFVVG